MRWSIRNSTEWHHWFAWHPVVFDDGEKDTWVWLEWIERRHVLQTEESDAWWQYRAQRRQG